MVSDQLLMVLRRCLSFMGKLFDAVGQFANLSLKLLIPSGEFLALRIVRLLFHQVLLRNG